MITSNTNKRIAVLAFYINQQGNVTEKYFGKDAKNSMASDRLQLMPALLSAKRMGYQVEVFSLHSSNTESIINTDEYEICLVAKMNANTNKLIKTMISANTTALNLFKKSGCKIITLYCDNLMYCNESTYSRASVSGFYKQILELTNAIIFPCEKMRELSRQYAKFPSKDFIIHDPWQLKHWHSPKALDRGQECRLIWFGNNKNFNYLLDCLPNLITTTPENRRFLLTILGSKSSHDLAREWIKSYQRRDKNWRFRLAEWHPKYFAKQLEAEISNSHISILPSDPSDPRKAGVSHNRLVDSIKGGCITICSPMQSYKELSNLSLIGDNLGETLNEALTNYDKLNEHIKKYRETELDQFSPKNNAKSWDECWKIILQTG